MVKKATSEQVREVNKKYGTQYQLATELNHLLTDAAANQVTAINRLHRLQKINITQLSLLYDIISHGGTTTQTELADYFPYTKQAMTLALNYLEENELIVRKTASKDRRIKNISITTKGLDLASEAMQIRLSFYQALNETLSEKESEVLVELLQKLNCFYKRFMIG